MLLAPLAELGQLETLLHVLLVLPRMIIDAVALGALEPDEVVLGHI